MFRDVGIKSCTQQLSILTSIEALLPKCAVYVLLRLVWVGFFFVSNIVLGFFFFLQTQTRNNVGTIVAEPETCKLGTTNVLRFVGRLCCNLFLLHNAGLIHKSLCTNLYTSTQMFRHVSVYFSIEK